MEGPFEEEDVLYRRMFCIGGRFVEGRSVEGRLVEERFVGRTFCSGGRFVEGCFVVVPVSRYEAFLIPILRVAKQAECLYRRK